MVSCWCHLVYVQVGQTRGQPSWKRQSGRFTTCTFVCCVGVSRSWWPTVFPWSQSQYLRKGSVSFQTLLSVLKVLILIYISQILDRVKKIYTRNLPLHIALYLLICVWLSWLQQLYRLTFWSRRNPRVRQAKNKPSAALGQDSRSTPNDLENSSPQPSNANQAPTGKSWSLKFLKC